MPRRGGGRGLEPPVVVRRGGDEAALITLCELGIACAPVLFCRVSASALNSTCLGLLTPQKYWRYSHPSTEAFPAALKHCATAPPEAKSPSVMLYAASFSTCEHSVSHSRGRPTYCEGVGKGLLVVSLAGDKECCRNSSDDTGLRTPRTTARQSAVESAGAFESRRPKLERRHAALPSL